MDNITVQLDKVYSIKSSNWFIQSELRKSEVEKLASIVLTEYLRRSQK